MKPKQDESVEEGNEPVEEQLANVIAIDRGVVANKFLEMQVEIDALKKELEILGTAFLAAQNKLTRCKIVVNSKLTRRQQKMWPKWIEGVDLSGELKTKDTFAFPKISMRYLSGERKRIDGEIDDSALRYAITNLTEKDSVTGFTNVEATDIVEYLNSFPENQHHLKNLDSEFRDEEVEKRMRDEMKK